MERERTTEDSDFVLDEGLEDEDEDVLAFEAERQRNRGGSPAAHVAEAADKEGLVLEEGIEAPDVSTDAVVIDGIPAKANRSHLEELLSGCGEIVALKIHRFSDKTLIARVQLSSAEMGSKALQLSGSVVLESHMGVTITPAPEDWPAFLAQHPKGTSESPIQQATGLPRGAAMVTAIPAALPSRDGMRNAFWSAFRSAQKAAETLEQKARETGEDLDRRLNVSENVGEVAKRSAAVIDNIDQQYGVSKKMQSAAEAGQAQASIAANSAAEMNRTYGVTRKLSAMSSTVSSVGNKALREIDENLRISERAQAATNAALANDRIGPAVKSASATFDEIVASAEQKLGGQKPASSAAESDKTGLGAGPSTGPSTAGVRASASTVNEIP